jgi:hypothetical protein
MAKAKNTRELSNAHEEFLADTLPGGRRSKTSGASWHDPVDVTTDYHVIEAKATENKSITLKLEDWEGIRKKAHGGKIPAMALRFKDPYSMKVIDLLVIEVADELELLEKAWKYDDLST